MPKRALNPAGALSWGQCMDPPQHTLLPLQAQPAGRWWRGQIGLTGEALLMLQCWPPTPNELKLKFSHPQAHRLWILKENEWLLYSAQQWNRSEWIRELHTFTAGRASWGCRSSDTAQPWHTAPALHTQRLRAVESWRPERGLKP